MERRLAAIMFSDIAGYTALMAESEAKGLRAREQHRGLLRPLAARYHGRIVDETGDELLLVFPSDLDAVNCALAAQAALRDDPDLTLRIGIHAGDVVFEGGRVYGDGVNVASRIRPLAEPGGICISDEVQHSIQNQPNVETRPLGEQALKNVPRPVPVFAVTGTANPPERGLGTAAIASQRLALQVALVLAAAVLAGLAVCFLNRPGPEAVSIQSIAVLPFADMSPAGDQEYFADGMAEELINILSKVEGLRVVARTSAFAFKGKNEDIREIGDQLDVGAIVEGSVRKAGDRLRITTQLVRADDGFHLWSETYDRTLDDVFVIQTEIARAVANVLEVKLLGEALSQRRPANLRAYELYLTGRFFWGRFTEPDLTRAAEYFERALAVDPEFALAWAGLAETRGDQWDMGWDPRDEVYEQARQAARRALELDPDLAEARAAWGWLATYELDWETAERELRRAIELKPSYALAWVSLSAVHMEHGRIEEALAAVERSLELEPLSSVYQVLAGRFHLYAGHPEQALARLHRGLDLSPENQGARFWLAFTHAFEGREAEAAREYLRMDHPEPLKEAFQAGLDAVGFREGIRRALEWRVRESGSPCPRDADLFLAWLGESERMFHCLEEAMEQRGSLAYQLVDPFFAPYREDPRFQKLLLRQRLPTPPPAI